MRGRAIVFMIERNVPQIKEVDGGYEMLQTFSKNILRTSGTTCKHCPAGYESFGTSTIALLS